MHLEYYPSPQKFPDYFTEDVCRKSFSNSVHPDITELDFFYIIKFRDEVIGFHRIIDLFFDSEIELHGSYGYKNNTHIKSYFFLSCLFVATVVRMFPERKISSLVNENNKPAIHHLKWLGFYKTTPEQETSEMQYFELDKRSLFQKLNRICR